jgi:hypothetical protein
LSLQIYQAHTGAIIKTLITKIKTLQELGGEGELFFHWRFLDVERLYGSIGDQLVVINP